MFTYMTDNLHVMVSTDDMSPLYSISKKIESIEEAFEAMTISPWNLALVPLELFSHEKVDELIQMTTINKVQVLLASYPKLKKALPDKWELTIQRYALKLAQIERDSKV